MWICTFIVLCDVECVCFYDSVLPSNLNGFAILTCRMSVFFARFVYICKSLWQEARNNYFNIHIVIVVATIANIYRINAFLRTLRQERVMDESLLYISSICFYWTLLFNNSKRSFIFKKITSGIYVVVSWFSYT